MQPVKLIMALALAALCQQTLPAQNKPIPQKKPVTQVTKPTVKTKAQPAVDSTPKTAPAPEPDPYIEFLKTINTNTEPKLVWVSNAGGGGNDNAADVAVLENGYLLLGQTNSSNGDIQRSNTAWNTWLSYFDRKGNYLKGKLYGGSASDYNAVAMFTNYKDSTITFFAEAMSKETNSKPDGPYKHPEGDIWMVKVRMQDMSVVFQKTFGSNKEERPFMVKRLKNGHFLVAAQVSGTGGEVTGKRSPGEDVDIWLLIITPDGTIVRQASFGGSSYDFVYDAISTSDQNYLLVGKTKSKDLDFTGAPGSDETAFVIKIDTLFNIKWIKHFGHTGSSFYNLAVINSNEGDGYIINTYPDANEFNKVSQGRSDFVMTKVNTDGNVVWYKNFGGKSSDNCTGLINDVKKDGYILFGTATSNEADVKNNHSNSTPSSYPNRFYSDIWFVKADNNGNLVWQKTVGGENDDDINQVRQFPNGAMVFAGSSQSKSGQVKGNKGNADYYIGLLSFTDSTVVEPNRTSLPSCAESQNVIADFTDIVECIKQKRTDEGMKLNKESVFESFEIYTTSNIVVIDIVVDNCGTLSKAPVVKMSAGNQTITLTTHVNYTGNGIAIFSQAVKDLKNIKLTDLKTEGLPKNCYYRILVHEK